MYYYEIGYNTYEEGDSEIFTHEEKFTRDEITEMLAKIFVNHLEEVEEDCFSNSMEYFTEFLVYKYLQEVYGFEVLDREKWIGFGWADIMDETDWEDERKGETNELMEKIKELMGDEP